MKIMRILWVCIGIIILGWIYYFYISPNVFKQKELIVPNLIGLKEEEVKNILDSSKIKYTIHYIDGESLCVDATYPTQGSKIYQNYSIDVFILKPLPTHYQNFVGLMYEENIQLIEEYCDKHTLRYKVEYEIQNEFASGQIFYQSKSVEEVILPDDEIVFKIAVHDDYICFPNLCGLKILDAIQILDQYDLKYNIIYYHAPIEEDVILSQAIEEGSIIKKGNPYAFDIYVSKGMPIEFSNNFIEDFIFVLKNLNENFDIIYVASSETTGKVLKIIRGDKYYIYIAE